MNAIPPQHGAVTALPPAVPGTNARAAPPAPAPYLLRKRKVTSPNSASAPHPIELLILQYCTHGEKACEHFQAGSPCYCILMQQRGNKGNDSAFFKLKEHLLLYLTEMAAQPDAQDQPTTLAELVPCLHHDSYFKNQTPHANVATRLFFVQFPCHVPCSITEAQECQLCWQTGTSPHWQPILYCGGGDDGLQEGARHLANYVAWLLHRRNKPFTDIDVHLYGNVSPTIFAETPFAITTPAGRSSLDLKRATAPSGPCHLTVQVALADPSAQAFLVRIHGNSYPLRDLLRPFEFETSSDPELGYTRASGPLRFNDPTALEFITDLGAVLHGSFFLLGIAADIPAEISQLLRQSLTAA